MTRSNVLIANQQLGAMVVTCSSLTSSGASSSPAVGNPLVRAVLLYDSQVEDPEGPRTDVGLALSMDDGPEVTWRLANFISHRRVWKAELETALGLVVQLELANREGTPEAGYVELWRA
jgi:hypothetical protein